MNQQIIFIFRYHSSCIKWFSKWFSLYLKDLFKNIFAPLLGVDGSQPPENRARWTRVEFTSELIIFAGSCFDKFVVTPLQRKTIWKIKTKQKPRMNLHRLDYSWEFCRFSQTLQTFWIQWSLCRFQRRFRIIFIPKRTEYLVISVKSCRNKSDVDKTRVSLHVYGLNWPPSTLLISKIYFTCGSQMLQDISLFYPRCKQPNQQKRKFKKAGRICRGIMSEKKL